MENETKRPTEGLLEPVHQGSVTFNESILAPLHSNYLYKESKEFFTYNSAHLINNPALQQRYAAFRSEKQEKGYSEQELEESFGFLLLDDINRARKVGEAGLLVGRAKCTTLGDSLKGVYISKYSDCLDLKRWYDGKTGYIVLLKLTKGKVKEVKDNYTQNFTPPTPGFDCHVSEQLGAISSTTSSFLAFERTQYYFYELCSGSSETEACPRHACPFAIVAFSYGKMSTSSELEQKSQDKTVFHYKPWIGQFKIESNVYDVGLQSTSGAWFPTKLPKTVKIDHAIGVSELKRTLPREIFETCIVGEVCIGGRCFNLYDVVSSKAKNDLAQIAQELKEKDMALVIPLEDSGFLILLHSSHLFSFEDAKSGKAEALQGMFIFPDSRTVPRDTKTGLQNTKVSTEMMQVIPALNYAETEIEKSTQNQHGASQASLEKHLQDYGTLFHTEPLDIPTREASMFPDQYDVPGGFTLISPKWTKETGTRLKSYFDEPCGFTIPVVRALELLTTGRKQRGDDHDDDDVYYYISSPEEMPQTDASIETEMTKLTEATSDASDRINEILDREKDEHAHLSTEQLQPAVSERLGKLGTAVVTADSVLEYPTSTVSPKLGDVPTENSVSIDTNVEKISQGSNKGDADGVCVDLSTKETPIQNRSTPLITSAAEGDTAVGEAMEDGKHTEKTMADPKKKVNRRPYSVRKVNSTEVPTKDKTQTETLHADDTNQKPHSTRSGKGYRPDFVKQNISKARKDKSQEPLLNVSTESVSDQSMKDETSLSRNDWRSLPRRKRLWSPDASLKRSLRSNTVKNENESIADLHHDDTKRSLPSVPKRKMEGCNLRERYGLKTIITNCGRVFVPHGSDVDGESANKRQNDKMQDKNDSNPKTVSPVENKSIELVESKGESASSEKVEFPSKDPVVNDDEDPKDSPSTEMPSALLSALKILRKLHQNNPLELDKSQNLFPEKSMNTTSNETIGLQQTNKDNPVAVQADATSSPPKVSEQSKDSDPKVSSPDKNKKKTKHSVYSAISISKLKTVLRRGKKVKSPSPSDGAKSEADNPESKRQKLNPSMGLMYEITKNKLKDKISQPRNNEAQHTPIKTVDITKQPVSWRGLISKTQKENGSLNFDPSASFEIAKHTDQQLISSLIGDRVGRRRISIDGKASTERLSTGPSLPSDALSLLADLALGASNDKMLTNLEAKPGLEDIDVVKASGSPESVLHALLRCPSARFKLPPRSPFPESLLATGELILEISKEHSYSQSTSSLSGPSSQVSSLSGCVESPLSLKSGLLLNLPKDSMVPFHQEDRGKTEWKHLISPNKPVPSIFKTKTRRPKILRNRCIIEKEGKIEVMRTWKEAYDFKYDSKFTNDSLDKTVSRALHGKWNFNIEDTFEDVHLIFHMWIGLFYSKSTSRLFHLENSTILPKGKDIEKVHLDKNAIQSAVSLLNVELNTKEGSSKPVHVSSGVLDLSVKNGEHVTPCSVSTRSTTKDTASEPVGILSKKHETPPRHSSSGTSGSPSRVKALMNYRSAVDTPQEKSVPDSDTDTDEENDLASDHSYSQIMEANSAYTQLCDQASNMRIGIRIHLPKIRSISNNTASTPDPKKICVFHQILKPAEFSSPSRLILGQKHFDLSLNNKTCHATHQKKDVSDSSDSKGILKSHGMKEGCPENVADRNHDKTLEFSTGDAASVSIQKQSLSVTEESKKVSNKDSLNGPLKIVEIMTSEMPNKIQTTATKHNETAQDLKPIQDLKGHIYKVDDLRDDSSLETSVEEHNETSDANDELDDTNVDELSDISSDETRAEERIETSGAKEDLKPLPDQNDHANTEDDQKVALLNEASVEKHLQENTNAVHHVDEQRDISSDEMRAEKHNETASTKEDLKHVHEQNDHTNTDDDLNDSSTHEIIVKELKETSNAKEDLKPVHEQNDHTNMDDDLNDSSTHEIIVEELKETSNAKEDLKPVHEQNDHTNTDDDLNDGSTHEIIVEELKETSNAKEDLKPVHDLKDHAKTDEDLKDASTHTITVEEHKETSSANGDLKDSSTQQIIIEEHKKTFNAKEDLKPLHNLKDPTTVVDELKDASSDGTNDNNTSNDQEDLCLKVQSNAVDTSSHVIGENDTEEHVEKKEGHTGEEMMQEDKIKSKERVKLNCSDTEHETFTAMAEHSDEFILRLNDDTNSVDMEFSDEDDCEMSGNNDMKMQKSVKQPMTPEKASLEYNILQEFANDSCSDEDQPMLTQETEDEEESGQQDVPEARREEDTLVEKIETQSTQHLSLKTGPSLPKTGTDFSIEMFAPQDLKSDKPSELEINSTCSTPTQDEIREVCYPEVNKELREDLDRKLYCPDNTVAHHIDMLPPESPESSQTCVSTSKPLSNLMGHHEETHHDEPRWKMSKFSEAEDFKDKSVLTTEDSSSEDSFQLRHKFCPTYHEKDKKYDFRQGASQNDSELFYGHDDVDDFYEYYHGTDEGLQWYYYQTEEPVVHPRESDFCGDYELPTCSKQVASESEYFYKHKKRARKEMDEYCWEQNYKTEPKYPIKVTCTTDYAKKKKSRKSEFRQNSEWDDDDTSSSFVDYSIQKISSSETHRSVPTRVMVSSHPSSSKQQFDWRKYFRREATSSQLLDACERDNKFDVPPSSIVTILDRKGYRVTFSNSPTAKPSFAAVSGSSSNKSFEDSFNRWQERQSKADGTRSTVDCEYLIFSDQMNQVLRDSKSPIISTPRCRSNPEQCGMTVQFSNLSENESSDELKAQPPLSDFKLKVDLSERKGMRESIKTSKPHFQKLFCGKPNVEEFAGISEITEQCAVAYKSRMKEVCSGKTLPRPIKAFKRKYNREGTGQHPRSSGRYKKDVFDSPQENLKSVVRQASKKKYRFYIHVTSTDTFFEETKNLMEIEGHMPVEPDNFNLDGDDQCPLLIILRNEDIAEHICEVPHLLELKKSPSVLFAGIDRPDDVVNCTHQELFAKGGFIMCDELAINTLTLDDMKKLVGILEELDKQGKWKWFLHYRDSRRLRESARSSPEANKKQQFIDFCQKAGVIEVLPYHDCDVISRERPDYFFCLTRLQIQNASVRFPVFITETPTEAFGTNGILSMNIYTFSRILSNDTCSVS
ncbi:uncharacterized protein tasor2 isoform X2 [Danio aesculapii]|uniref:uncharacterized protein tasor2 isoform X2 n=1 Tax=Danio aesculapii TaxID=1142201 RepID=UPI0024C0D9A6|nr:uncharacterized protein tasor2 isoform X2 [Danio aesculapii]